MDILLQGGQTHRNKEVHLKIKIILTYTKPSETMKIFQRYVTAQYR